VEQRYAGEVLEATVYQIIIVRHPANAGIGMEAGDNGVLIALSVLGETREIESQSEE